MGAMQRIKTLEDLQAEAVAHIERYRVATIPNASDRRDAAEALVHARGLFNNRDGRPDWTGRTAAYRAWVRETLQKAGVQPADVASWTSGLRYHSSQILREILTPEQLAELGLAEASGLVTKRERRASDSESRALLSPAGPLITDPADIELLAETLAAIVARVDVSEMSPQSVARKRIEKATASLDEVLGDLAGAAKRAR